ncbi:Lathosterol oxidase [Pseudomonas sp. 8BK]|jgi:sterol desaturase/sphingolipid hydroxylase (fatty acid hydroxylase superfamily)|uniref:sterol desaturase family protein n=1 Tax=unclassified Pseudomonas TaxID=196821 RepID=UPI0012F00298|nr:sterol desaturase family protein [Pseudomonas sp. 8BK]VXC00945.1 Lathosterol oxidase [Pseudomonas sp. 8BK]
MLIQTVKAYFDRHGSDAFRIGEGRISGYISATTGILSLLAVLCFLFPEWLTFAEFRKVYSEQFARSALLIGLACSFGLGTLNILVNKRKRLGITGMLTSGAALLLGGSNIQFDTIGHSPYSLGLDWFILALLVSAIVFIPLEKLYAKDPELQILRPHWRTDLCYFFVSHMAVQFILIFVTASSSFLASWAVSDTLQETVRSLPIVVQFVMAVFVADLGQYWLHRLYHVIPWMWKFHAVHHSSTAMDWLAGSRVHFAEVLLTRTGVLVPLMLLGFSTEAMNAYVILIGVQAVLAHANVKIDGGWLNYILVLPRYHHWHHARHIDYIYKNYAIHTPLVDMLFGTFKLPPKEWPTRYGVFGKELPKGMLKQLAYPFKRTPPAQ